MMPDRLSIFEDVLLLVRKLNLQLITHVKRIQKSTSKRKNKEHKNQCCKGNGVFANTQLWGEVGCFFEN